MYELPCSCGILYLEGGGRQVSLLVAAYIIVATAKPWFQPFLSPLPRRVSAHNQLTNFIYRCLYSRGLRNTWRSHNKQQEVTKRECFKEKSEKYPLRKHGKILNTNLNLMKLKSLQQKSFKVTYKTKDRKLSNISI